MFVLSLKKTDSKGSQFRMKYKKIFRLFGKILPIIQKNGIFVFFDSCMIHKV